MSKFCPIYDKIVLYLDCLECDDKLCKNNNIINNIIIGIDQSYKNTGITIIRNKTEVLLLTSINFSNYKNNSEKRDKLRKELDNLIKKCKAKYSNAKIEIIFERIRLQSQGFINIDYIKGIGALNATIIDIAYNNNIKCYSVDTRCWKSQIVGSSKPLDNNFGFGMSYDFIYGEAKRRYDEGILPNIYKYRKGEMMRELYKRNVILIDDGVESGLTMSVAIKTCVKKFCSTIRIATPVISSDARELLETSVDAIYSFYTPKHFVDTAYYYDDFGGVDSALVVEMLSKSIKGADNGNKSK